MHQFYHVIDFACCKIEFGKFYSEISDYTVEKYNIRKMLNSLVFTALCANQIRLCCNLFTFINLRNKNQSKDP